MTVEKRKPLGLGAAKRQKSDEAGAEETVEPNVELQTMFQLPEGDLSEEAEVKVIFDAAEAMYCHFRSLDEEELSEEKEKPEEERVELKAIKLYSGVIHECDRLLKLHDEQQPNEEPVKAEIFRMMGDSLFKLGSLSMDFPCNDEGSDNEHDDDTDDKVEEPGLFFDEALRCYDEGLELYPTDSELESSKFCFSLCMAIMKSAKEKSYTALLSLLETVENDLIEKQADLRKIRQIVLEFLSLLPKPSDPYLSALDFCATRLFPRNEDLTVTERVEKVVVLSSLAECSLEASNNVTMADQSIKLIDELLKFDLPDDNIDAEVAFGKLRSQYWLLKGSLCACQGDEAGENVCYAEALKVFQDLHDKYGTPIPEYILDLVN